MGGGGGSSASSSSREAVAVECTGCLNGWRRFDGRSRCGRRTFLSEVTNAKRLYGHHPAARHSSGLRVVVGYTVVFDGFGSWGGDPVHWIALDPSQSGLSIFSDWRVMTIAGVACAIEFIADKVPWVDSMWDSVHTFIRPIGAAVLGARAFMHTDPAVQVMLAILCGGLALSGHSVKAATRLAVNHSPEPFSNIALSLAGDAAVQLQLGQPSTSPP